MTKLTIPQQWTGLVQANDRGGFVANGDYLTAVTEAYEQGKKDATTWQPIEAATRPMPVVYLVMNNKGQVAPSIDGVIHNTIGTAWDWAYGELITHFMLMPLPKEPT